MKTRIFLAIFSLLLFRCDIVGDLAVLTPSLQDKEVSFVTLQNDHDLSSIRASFFDTKKKTNRTRESFLEKANWNRTCKFKNGSLTTYTIPLINDSNKLSYY